MCITFPPWFAVSQLCILCTLLPHSSVTENEQNQVRGGSGVTFQCSTTINLWLASTNLWYLWTENRKTVKGPFITFINVNTAGERAQWLGELAAFAADPSSVHSTHIVWLMTAYKSNTGASDTLFWALWALKHMHTLTHRHMHTHK